MDTISLSLKFAETPCERSKRTWNVVLFVTLPLAVASALAGAVINLLSFGTSESATLGRWGLGLTLLAFPLMMLTAHSLDKIRAMEREIRSPPETRTI
jgi:hypothetical protein